MGPILCAPHSSSGERLGTSQKNTCISKDSLLFQVKGYVDLARKEGCSVLCGDGMEEIQLPDRNQNVRKKQIDPFPRLRNIT